MLKMNYTDFARKTDEQIYKEAFRRGINPFNGTYSNKPRENIIGEIIAHDAYYEGRNDKIRAVASNVNTSRKAKSKMPGERERYRLQMADSDHVYYLQLTEEQIRFMHWCHENYFDFAEASVEHVTDIEYESP